MKKSSFVICTLFFNILIGVVSAQSIEKRAAEALKKSGLSLDEAKKLINSSNNQSKPSSKSKNLSGDGTNSDQIKISNELNDLNNFEKTLNESDNVKILGSSLEFNNVDEVEPENIDLKSTLDQKNNALSSILPANNNNISEKYFGYNTFKVNPEIFNNSNPTSITTDYQIGPGDEIIIMLWGETEFNEPFIVQRDGYIFIPNVGRVYVNSLTLEKLEKKLYKLLTKVYASLDSKNGSATSYMDVTLGSLVLRPLRIFILGDVDKPGAYSVKPSTSIFTSLFYVGGPSKTGSLRDIQLIRSGKNIGSIDFYKFILEGKKDGDKRLQRDDVIFIPRKNKTVEVFGEITKNAFFELKENESLIDLIDIAGGIKNTTYTGRVKIDRILPLEDRLKSGISRTIIDVDLLQIIKGKEIFKLYDGDKIEFFSISDALENIVTIEGNVKRPGVYDFGKGLRVKDLIEKADGLTINTVMEKAEIIRIDENLDEYYISFDLSKAMSGNVNNNLMLEPNDVLKVYDLEESIVRKNISISGFVIRPIDMAYKEGIKLKDLIFMSGGFQNEERLEKVYMERADLSRLNSDLTTRTMVPFRLDSVLADRGLANIELKMGDLVKIYSKEEVIGSEINTVSIEGNVKRPGIYERTHDMTIRDLLFLAGFIENEDLKENSILGNAHLYRKIDNKRVKKMSNISIDKIINGSIKENFLLEPEDKIVIFSKLPFEKTNNVKILGLVENPGDYDYKEGMSLKSLILESGGINKTDVFRLRAEISRVRDRTSSVRDIETILVNFNYSLSEFNLSGEKNTKNDVKLKENDVIVVRQHPSFTEEDPVSILGYIRYPGDYFILKENELVSSIIERAGGITANAFPLASTLLRDSVEINLSFHEILKNPRSKYNFSVQPGDQIKIKGKTNLVVVQGAVNSPGNYQYIKNQNLRDYIEMAGGFTKDASKYASFVKYPNGQSKRIKFLSLKSPKVVDGSVIVIGLKEEFEPFNFTEYVSTVTTVINDAVQAYVLVLLAIQNLKNT